MAVNIRDVAKELKLSPATVSSCLSGTALSKRIRRETVERVKQCAEQMGYIPNRLANRILCQDTRKNIGLILKYDEAYSRNMPVLTETIRILEKRNVCDYSVLYAENNDISKAIRQGIGLGMSDFLVIGYMHDAYLAGLRKLPAVN